MAYLELINFTRAVQDSRLQWLHQNKGSTQLSPICPKKIMSMMFKGLWEHDDWVTFKRKAVFEKDLLLYLSTRTVIVQQTQNYQPRAILSDTWKKKCTGSIVLMSTSCYNFSKLFANAKAKQQVLGSQWLLKGFLTNLC